MVALGAGIFSASQPAQASSDITIHNNLPSVVAVMPNESVFLQSIQKNEKPGRLPRRAWIQNLSILYCSNGSHPG